MQSPSFTHRDSSLAEEESGSAISGDGRAPQTTLMEIFRLLGKEWTYVTDNWKWKYYDRNGWYNLMIPHHALTLFDHLIDDDVPATFDPGRVHEGSNGIAGLLHQLAGQPISIVRRATGPHPDIFLVVVAQPAELDTPTAIALRQFLRTLPPKATFDKTASAA